MRRRDFVVASATAASVSPAAVTGCLSSEGEDEHKEGGDGREFGLTDLEDFADAEVSVDSRFESEPCPDLGDELTLCYHDIGTEPAVYLEPERETGDPRGEPLVFTLRNDSSVPVEYHSSGGWELHKKKEDSEWLKIMPWVTTLEGPAQMRSGGSNSWGVRMSSIEDIGEYYRSDGARYTGSGTYAFSATVGVKRYTDARFVALFEVEGEPLSFEPIGIDEYEREDGVVHARTESYEEGEDRFVLSVTVVDDAPEELAELHDEHAVQSNIVNNTVAFLDEDEDKGGTERVVFEGGEMLLRRAEQLERFGAVYEQLKGETVIKSLPDSTVKEYGSRLRFVNGDTAYEMTPVEYEDGGGEENKT